MVNTPILQINNHLFPYFHSIKILTEAIESPLLTSSFTVVGIWLPYDYCVGSNPKLLGDQGHATLGNYKGPPPTLFRGNIMFIVHTICYTKNEKYQN